MKMPTIVGIFIFISRENFMLSWIEHEKSFITLGPRGCIRSIAQIKKNKPHSSSSFFFLFVVSRRFSLFQPLFVYILDISIVLLCLVFVCSSYLPLPVHREDFAAWLWQFCVVLIICLISGIFWKTIQDIFRFAQYDHFISWNVPDVLKFWPQYA